MSDRRQIMAHLRTQQDSMMSLLKDLVLMETPSTDAASQAQIRERLKAEFEAIDYRVNLVPGRNSGGHVYASAKYRGRRQPAQLMLGHCDTVWPIGTLEDMPLVVEADRLRGPGVYDMKAGLVEMIYALRTIEELGLRPAVAPLCFINSDEEIGSRTSRRYICALAERARRAYVLEPSMGEEGAIKTERKGIGRFTITVHGKAAHAGLDPEGGASAILELSHVIQTLFALNDADKGITVNVGTVDGGLQPNVIAPHSQAVVDVRVPTIADGERIQEAIYAIEPVTPNVRLSIEGRMGRPSMEKTPRNEALWQQAKALGRELGLDLTEGRAGGGSDGNWTTQYTATLDGLGPVGHGAHAEHEFLYIDKTLERTALLALLLLAPPAEGEPS